MTDKRKAPEVPAGSQRRKRETPTIDLTATEVPQPEDTAAPASEPERPTQDQPAPAEQDQAKQAQAGAPEELAAAPEPAHQPVSGTGYGTAIAAGLAGGVIVAALLAALWGAGVLPVATGGKNRNAQLAALQKQMQALQNRPTPAANDQAVDALRQTVRKLENDIAKLPHSSGAVAARLNAIDHAMDSLNVEIGKLNTRADTIAAAANTAQVSAAKAEKVVGDLRNSVQQATQQASSAVAPGALDALRKQVAALEQSLKTTRGEIAKTSATDKTARLALSAVALRAAVASGQPYQAELAQAKSLGADQKQLAPLAQFASIGLPRKAALAHELRALLPAMLKASGVQAAPAGFLGRLEANASKIVRVSPVNAPQGDAPSDILARVEVAAAHDDIAGALADIDKLPQNARAPAQGWIAKVKARQQALAASRAFAASTARALGEQAK